MARPMLLIKQECLCAMYKSYKEGAPVLKLRRKFNLEDDITPPTLAKLLKTMANSEKIADAQTKQVIVASLFPEWLKAEEGIVSYQPVDWYYSGRFPLGRWLNRNEENRS